MSEDGIPAAVGLPIAFLLVFLNGFFVAAEFAIVKVRGTRLTELADGGNAAARQASAIVGRLDAYLAATQLGITMASLGLGWIGEPAVASVIEGPLHAAGFSDQAVRIIAFAVGFGLITLLHITIGELAPKSIAILRPEATTLVVALPLGIFTAVMWPVIWALNGIANVLLRLIGIRPASETELAHTDEELRLLLASSREHGVIDPIEQELATRSLELGEHSVRTVMVPRTAMVALSADLPVEDARRVAIHGRHSRLPVYRDSPDDVVGYIEWCDLFTDGSPRWIDRLRPMPIVPRSISASAALRTIREADAELALVLDEYGGTAGILTIRDLLGEIVDPSLTS